MFSAAIKSGAAGSPKDPQFNYVTMLLHGDGSASGNTTVTPFNADASTNNFNVTINGDARSNNFTPYQAGYYSNNFDGTSGQYLNTVANTAFNFGTGDFTVEGWVYPTTTSGTRPIVEIRTTGGATGFALLSQTGATTVNVYTNTGFAGASTNSLTTNQWNHVALTRSGNTWAYWINGVASGSFTNSSTQSDGATTGPKIGGSTTSGEVWIGYLSNIRIIKGTAVYTSSFTPSTTPLTAISGTSLLTCQSNRFIDNSTNAFAITVNGSPQVSPAQPFTLPTTVATYGSGYFDGSGDYLTQLTATTALNLSSGDWSISFWVYKTATANGSIVNLYNSAGNTSGLSIWIGSGGVKVDNGVSGGVQAGTVVVNSWSYIEVIRSSGTTTIYVNGVSAGTTTQTPNASQFGSFGSAADGSLPHQGYIADLRIVKGTALSSSVPTTPLAAITNTSILTTQYNGGGNNSGFKDSSQFNFPITRNGNTTQGTFTPYGSNWSAYFNGSNGSKVDLASAPLPSTGAFTFECFIFPLSFSALMIVYSQYASSNPNRWYIGINTDGTVVMGGNTLPALTSTTTLTLNAWNYFAVTRDGSGNGKVFINGVLSNSNTGWTTTLDTVNPRISGFANPSELCVNGYLSNIRITNTNLYTASFAVPKSPLTAVSGTTLLTLQDNRYKDNSASAITLTPASTSIQRFSPFIPTTPYSSSVIGGSAYFDGNDYLTTPQNSAFNFGTGAFTVEAFVYITASNGTNQRVIGIGDGAIGGGPYTGWTLNINNALTTINWYRYDGTETNLSASYTFNTNTWYHIVAVRNGSSNLSMFVNGSRVYNNASATLTYNNVNTNPLYVGAINDGASPAGVKYFNGYISNARVVAGSAVYDPTSTTLTVPTSPLTTITNTSFLLSNTNAAIFDNAMMNNLETVGNAQISTSVKKFGNASMYFDGTGDALYATSQSTTFGTGDFTIEFWVYFIAVNNGTPKYFYDMRNSGATSASFFAQESGNAWTYWNGAGTAISSGFTGSTFSATTWFHVAICRSSGVTKFFLNGTQTSSVADTSNYATTTLTVGSRYSFTEGLNGYIDDLRLTKYARYVTSFTPPTLAFPNN
jgi:hypothetical protein